jgi:Spy/CpxP family protein refolding chaperone
MFFSPGLPKSVCLDWQFNLLCKRLWLVALQVPAFALGAPQTLCKRLKGVCRNSIRGRSVTFSILLLAAVFLAPTTAWSQQPQQQRDGPSRPAQQRRQQPRKWWLDDRYRSALHLSAEQVARIDRIYEEHSVVQRELWNSLQQAEQEASTLIAVEAPNEAKVIAAIERTELLRYKLNERRALCLFRIRQQLSREQHLTLLRLHDENAKTDRKRGSH